MDIVVVFLENRVKICEENISLAFKRHPKLAEKSTIIYFHSTCSTIIPEISFQVEFDTSSLNMTLKSSWNIWGDGWKKIFKSKLWSPGVPRWNIFSYMDCILPAWYQKFIKREAETFIAIAICIGSPALVMRFFCSHSLHVNTLFVPLFEECWLGPHSVLCVDHWSLF